MRRLECITLLVLVAATAASCGDVDPSTTDDKAYVNPNKRTPTVDDDETPDVENPEDPTAQTDAPDDPVIVDEDPEPIELPAIPYEMAEPPAGATAPWPGELTSGALVNVAVVIDGDTVKVETDEGLVPLRLEAINAPECDKRPVGESYTCDPNDQDVSGDAEPFGVASWQQLTDLVQDRDVRVACKEINGKCQTDRYGRYIGFVLVDEVDVSEEMTRSGFAWTYTSFPPDNIFTYCVAENSAIDARRGMWKDGFSAAVEGMNPSTRSWYAYHDQTCSRYAP